MSDPVVPISKEAFKENVETAGNQNYIHRDFVALDEFINVITDGSPDETISSRMARWAVEEPAGSFKHKIGTEVCKALNIIQKDHGAIAESRDLGRAENLEKIEEASPTVKAEEQ